MKYCIKCAMPDTRPGSIFNNEGVCQACLNFDKRKSVNWEHRKCELDKICDKYRRPDGYYDCIIPVSGGKDSHRLLYEIKTKRKMNPLLVTVGDPFTKTESGLHNYRNLGDTFGCDHILFDLSIDLFRKVTRIAFEETGEPLRFVEVAIYTVPFKLAVKFGIPLVVFGENSAYEYGTTHMESRSANVTFMNLFKTVAIDFWLQKGISKNELNAVLPPSEKELQNVKPEVIFMSYFIPWSSTINIEIARNCGFKDLAHEWKREGCIEDFEQIDSVAYMVHLWLKYPKFGFQRTSDIASRRVREGNLSLDEAKRLIRDNDYKLDRKALDDFINTLGYTHKEFWDIVEHFWNRDIFEKVGDKWLLKKHFHEQLMPNRAF
ncbi:MAG: N-acetyl sugar amidotransferase [Candidatus Omnitrophica bacterium]|nr:N-acetyl sugar amidotransferase [Candidatus Omnitrophota bacterium]